MRLTAQLDDEVRTCCATQAPSGFAVQAMNSTRRVVSQMKKRASIRCSPTVKKPLASVLTA